MKRLINFLIILLALGFLTSITFASNNTISLKEKTNLVKN